MRRLLLIRHAPTGSTVNSVFAEADQSVPLPFAPLASPELDACTRILCSTAARTRMTAEAFGPRPQVDALLDECDFGAWSGRTFKQIHECEPLQLAEWLRDPDAAPHGGESLTHTAERVGRFLEIAASLDGITAALTHGGFIKIAIVLALGAPLSSMWRADVAPLSITELEHFDEGWTLRRANWIPADPA